MMFFNIQAPIYQTYLQMTRLFKCKNIFTGLYCFESDIAFLKSEPVTLDLRNTKYIVVNPNASDLRIERRWHKSNFIETINRIVSLHPEYQVYFIGSKSERVYVEEIVNTIDLPNVFSLAGKTNLDELIAVITHASLMISNDSGPYHLAVAQKTPVVGLFGPCSPSQYGNYGNSYTIYKHIYCSPCVHEFSISPCNGNNVCMQLISPEEVLERAGLLLKCVFPDTQSKKDGIIYDHFNNPLGLVHRGRGQQ